MPTRLSPGKQTLLRLLPRNEKVRSSILLSGSTPGHSHKTGSTERPDGKQSAHRPSNFPAVPDHLTPLVASFERSLRARNLSDKTIRAYRDTALAFCEFHTGPMDPEQVTRGDIEDFITDQLDRFTPSTAATRYRCLQQWWKWLVDEGETDESPMRHMSPPSLGEVPVPVFTDSDLRALLAACDGSRFEDRRDTALVRLFYATGIRLGEMASLGLEHVHLDDQAALVTGKGDRARWVTFGDKATIALDRYLRVRRRHRRHASEWLWVGDRGRLTDSGIDQALRKRALRAGVEGFRCHRFRHTFAHRWLSQGGAEGDLQELAGWRSPQMLARYGASARSERARQAYRRIDVEGDV
jgi:site-specific recombinase XerD